MRYFTFFVSSLIGPVRIKYISIWTSCTLESSVGMWLTAIRLDNTGLHAFLHVQYSSRSVASYHYLGLITQFPCSSGLCIFSFLTHSCFDFCVCPKATLLVEESKLSAVLGEAHRSLW